MRVLTYNTWKCDGHYRERLKLMADGLAGLAPDLCLLQECFQAPELDADTAETLSAATGLIRVHDPLRAAKRRVRDRTVDSTSGLCLLSRHMVSGHACIQLPTDPRDGERAAQVTTLDTPAGPLRVVNTHLTYFDEASTLRWEQVDTILDHLPRDDVPVLLGGDLNAASDEPLFALLADAGFTRAGGDFGTMVTNDGRTPRKDPPRIDHLLARGAGFETVERVLDRPAPDERLYPSDHAGVMARVSF